jgi:hypothetical protein
MIPRPESINLVPDKAFHFLFLRPIANSPRVRMELTSWPWSSGLLMTDCAWQNGTYDEIFMSSVKVNIYKN